MEFAGYCEENGLQLNYEKTLYMRFLSKNITPDQDLLIKLSGKSIESTQ